MTLRRLLLLLGLLTLATLATGPEGGARRQEDRAIRYRITLIISTTVLAATIGWIYLAARHD